MFIKKNQNKELKKRWARETIHLCKRSTLLLGFDERPSWRSTAASLVEEELVAAASGHRLVALLEVLGQDHVAVLAHGLHARLLADGVDLGTRELVGPVLCVVCCGEPHADPKKEVTMKRRYLET